MSASLTLSTHPSISYLLRIGDSCLILAQRLSEWCGHAPVLEEDIALSNVALDLLGQARAVLTHAGQLDPHHYDEDQLAFLRDERDYRNLTLVELPCGDFAFTVLRNFLMASFLKNLWAELNHSTDKELVGIAAKALKEAAYHQRHAADWVICLGQGTVESQRRLYQALATIWPYTPEIFLDDDIDLHAAQSGLGPRWSLLRKSWLDEIDDVFDAAGLVRPSENAFLSTGKNGRHSEHMGYILAEMQTLQRSFPGGVW